MAVQKNKIPASPLSLQRHNSSSSAAEFKR